VQEVGVDPGQLLHPPNHRIGQPQFGRRKPAESVEVKLPEKWLHLEALLVGEFTTSPLIQMWAEGAGLIPLCALYVCRFVWAVVIARPIESMDDPRRHRPDIVIAGHVIGVQLDEVRVRPLNTVACTTPPGILVAAAGQLSHVGGPKQPARRRAWYWLS
jgi:hypothetical protein